MGDIMEDFEKAKKRIEFENIRAIELRFDKIIKNDNSYILMQNDLLVGTVSIECLNYATRSKLNSLAEFGI